MFLLGKLKIFDGIPIPYDQQKRKVVPAALKVLRIQNFRKFCVLGDLSSSVGWKKKDLLEKLEAKRMEKSKRFYERKLADKNRLTKAKGDGKLKQLRDGLAKFGY